MTGSTSRTGTATSSRESSSARPAVLDRISAWLRVRPVVGDAGIAAVVALADLITVQTGLDAVLAVGMAAALVLRRIRPLACGLLVAVGGAVTIIAGATPGAVVPAVLAAGYALAAYGPRWSGVAAAVTSVAGAGLMLMVIHQRSGGGFSSPGVQGVFGTAVVVSLTVWLAGTLRRASRRNLEHLRERARFLEAEQATQARLARLAERARIAREMHDIIAHSLSVIVVQADGGRFLDANAGSAPAESAASVFADIADTGRSALADVRDLLGVLHEDDDGVGEVGPGTPQPGIEAIPALVDDLCRTGTRFRLVVSGEPRALPAGTSLTVYRAVQEAMTNTVKHAGQGAHAVVELSWRSDHLAVDVVDDGPVHTVAAAATASLGGYGMRGMRERVGAHGGTVESGPRPGGGFGVHLEVPYREPLL